MPLKRVHIDGDGLVRVNSRITASIMSIPQTESRVFLLTDEGGMIEAAQFRNYRPSATARSWTRYILQRKTPAQVIKDLRTSEAVHIAQRLGWKSPAQERAEKAAGTPAMFTGRKFRHPA